MTDDKKEMADAEVKDILARIPMTERLEDAEHNMMKKQFLQAVRETSKPHKPLIPPLFSLWRNPWVGYGAGAFACLVLAFFLLNFTGSKGITNDEGVGRGFDGRVYFTPGGDTPASTTGEVESATSPIESATRIQVNQVPWESLCGPRSVWVAAARLGVNLDLEKIIASCEVTQEGCSMWNLKRSAEAFGFQATGKRMSVESLFDLDTPAILLVEGNHFSCVDPTEDSGDGKIRYYNPPSSAVWVSQKDLEKKWNGEALVIERLAKESRKGPSASFDSVFSDLGKIEDSISETAFFTIANNGTEPLEILNTKHSCGCINTEVTKNPIQPGDTALVVAEMVLQGRDGIRSEMIEVETNDPDNPSVVLVIQAEHNRTLLLSNDFLEFGVVTPIHPVERRITIEDKSEQGIPIRRTEVIMEGGIHPPPTIAITMDPAEPEEAQSDRKHTYLLSASVPPETPIGTYKGKMRIHAGEKEDKTVEVGFQLTVESSYLVSPPHVSFGVVKAGEAIERSLVVRNRANQEIRVISHEVKYDTAPCSLSMAKPGERLKEVPIDLTLEVPEWTDEGTAVAKGSLILHPEEGPDFEVPWSAIVKKGR